MIPGQRLGGFEVTTVLGEGGMGQVWRARDTKLDREVALKVLPPGFADDPERRARFEREARVLAALNHPHVATLYGLEQLEGQHVLVMELVEGEGLDRRLARGPVPLDEAVTIARQIADGLEAAHEAGIVHRDLKPANIRIRADGTVKVLDFGLAKAYAGGAGAGSSAGLSQSPTLAHSETQAGVILGTAAYMSPEQARGKPVDKRTDIWAFGAVLYEMLTGRALFAGETVSDVLAAVLTREPEWTRLPGAAPRSIRRLLRRCLARDPRQRLHDIADARIELAGDPEEVPTPTQPESRGARILRLAPWVLLLAVAIALWGPGSRSPSSPAPLRRYLMALPDGEEIGGWFARLALSPDGSRLVYVTEGARGVRELILRPLDQAQGRQLAGTEGAEVPFFSPDGEFVGFFSPRGTLKVVPAEGGEAIPVARTEVGYAGASWGPDGFIYADADGEGGLVRVRASGGTPEPFTKLDASRDEREHIWPEVLPHGNAVLFVIRYQSERDQADIAVADVATGQHRVLVSGAYARYAVGHLFSVNWPERSIRYQPFDDESLTLGGEAAVLTDDVRMGAVGAPYFVPDLAVSRSGTLMTTTSGRRQIPTEVDWVSRDGTFRMVDPAWTDQLGGGGGGRVMLSPNGERLAVTLGGEIWIKQLDRGPLTKLTFEGGFRPEWSHDGQYVAFISARDGVRKAYRRRADGTGPVEQLLAHDWQIHEVVYSRDGEWLVYRVGGGGEGDLFAVRADGSGEPVPLVVSHAQESQPALSPDSRWLAYMSLETGRPEVWVRPFPNAADGRWQVSPDGGTGPQWAHSGRELFYRDGNDDLVSVEITPGPSFTYGAPRVLFSASRFLAGIYRHEYTVAPDDQRFVFVRELEERRPDLLLVIDNVAAALQVTQGS